MKVHLVTFGCKANQYDTERFRQELEARGARIVEDPSEADACVINTCTVTNQADAVARRAVRKIARANPEAKIVVAGCSAALRGAEYQAMDEVFGVVGGHDAVSVADWVAPAGLDSGEDHEPIGATLLARSERGTRAWLKIQDGCDRRCSFCATKLARGKSRSRHPDEIVREAAMLAANHPEIVITGVHIGHYGHDLNERGGPRTHTLSALMERLVRDVGHARYRLGSVEATEVDDRLIELLEGSGGVLAPHLHVPMQSGSDPILGRMRRWHSRAQYRDRMLQIAHRVGATLGLGADIITGFPGERDEHHAQTRALVEELPFTYLHVFPYSRRDGTPAATMPDQVPHAIAAERSRELREVVQQKGALYRRSRAGQAAEIVVEEHEWGITEDYLRVKLVGRPDERLGDRLYAPLQCVESEEDAALLIARV